MMDFKTKPETLALVCSFSLSLLSSKVCVSISLVRCSLAMENSVGDGGGEERGERGREREREGEGIGAIVLSFPRSIKQSVSE